LRFLSPFLAAYALSSGTIGAALSSSLSKTRAIALSYGTVTSEKPTELFEPSHVLSCNVIRYLWHNWGKDEGLRDGEVDLYSINVPMVEELLSDSDPKICWTSMWRNSYGSLFMDISDSRAVDETRARPDELNDDESRDLLFRFSPDRSTTVPAASDLPAGSDARAVYHGWVSVAPLRATFAQPPVVDGKSIDGVWKIKL